MTTHEGFRHLYTVAPAAPEDGGGNPAFRTVAVSDSLEAVRPELEEIVGAFTSPADRRLSRQAVRMYDEGYVALTTTTPLDGGPDGRRGNYLAETFVVPTAWLGDSGDDLAAAFAALPWSDPREVELAAGGVRSLGAGQVLPRLLPGPLSRLEVLRERVPETLLAPLLAAVARAALGRRPLVVVEGSAGGVDRLVPLLPLVLPPTARRVRADEGSRTVQIRTWSPPGESPTVDLVGVPADARGAAERAGGVVLDLSGPRTAETATADDPAGRFGQWAAGVIAAGDWQALAAAHERAGDASIEAFLDGFEAPAGGAASDSLLDARRADWLSREALDRLFVERSRSLAAEHQKAAQQLEQQVDAAFDDLQRQLDARIDARTTDLSKVAGEGTQALDQAAKTALEKLRKAAEEKRRQLETAGRELGKGLGRRPRAEEGANIPRHELSSPPSAQRVSRDLPRPVLYVVVAGAATVVLALSVWWWLQRSNQVPDNSDTTTVTEAISTSEDVDLQPALERLSDGAIVRRLLIAGVGQNDPDTQDAAARIYLDLILDDGASFSEISQAAMVQSILGVDVDGDFGPGSTSALQSYLNINAQCCSNRTEETQRSCVLALEIGGWSEQIACSGPDLFDGTHSWDLAAATKFLDRLRTAYSVASPTQKRNLAPFDLAQSPNDAVRFDTTNIDPNEAQQILYLARSIATGTAPSDSDVTNEELKAILDLPELGPN